MLRSLAGILGRVRPIVFPTASIAHRGDSQNAPENTLAAFRRAIDLGCEGIEMDVARTADGQLVVFHDKSLDRTTTERGPVNRRTLEEIRAADAGSWFVEEFRGEPVPTLGEALDLAEGRAVPFIEIKESFDPSNGVEGPIVRDLAERQMTERAVVVCRNEKSCRRLHELAPSLPLAYIAFRKRTILAAARNLPIVGLLLYHRWLSRDLVRELHRLRRFVAAWTVNTAPEMQAACELYVDGIITDCPGAFRDLREASELERFKKAILWDSDFDLGD